MNNMKYTLFENLSASTRPDIYQVFNIFMEKGYTPLSLGECEYEHQLDMIIKIYKFKFLVYHKFESFQISNKTNLCELSPLLLHAICATNAKFINNSYSPKVRVECNINRESESASVIEISIGFVSIDPMNMSEEHVEKKRIENNNIMLQVARKFIQFDIIMNLANQTILNLGNGISKLIDITQLQSNLAEKEGE